MRIYSDTGPKYYQNAYLGAHRKSELHLKIKGKEIITNYTSFHVDHLLNAFTWTTIYLQEKHGKQKR